MLDIKYVINSVNIEWERIKVFKIKKNLNLFEFNLECNGADLFPNL